MSPAQSEQAIVTLGVSFLFAAAIWRLTEWIRNARPTPDPWDTSIAAALQAGEAMPVCTRCLEPQTHDAWFCPHCGATVGPFVTWMPYLQQLALGDALRHGTSGRIPLTRVAVIGYACVGFCECLFLGPLVILAPFYWWRLARNVLRLQEKNRVVPPSPPPPPDSDLPPVIPAV
jgi:hypothetical protein